ncbi:hypothetical protein BDY24DRAFT_373672 [Mrakia frigida]|uniref:uncharacterized protein n=1 Tax=Mrakia frigida TaxID=29902 RepID=UPI003FCC1038
MASYGSPLSRAPPATTNTTTPFPSRPFLHSSSPSSSQQQTPPELRKLEGLWRELRRTHLSPPVKDKGKGREQQLEGDKENRPWQQDGEQSNEEGDERKVLGGSSRGCEAQGLSAGGIREGIRDEAGGGGAQIQLRPPRFLSSAIPPTPRASSSSTPPVPRAQRIPSASSAILSDIGTHRTTSFTFKPSPPPAPQPKLRSTSPPLAGPSRLRTISPALPSPPSPTQFYPPSSPPRIASPRRRQPSPRAASPPPNNHFTSSTPTPLSPLYTAHLPPSHQPLKHGYISIGSPSGVILVLRGRRWELSGDGEKLSYWDDLASPSSSPPLQQFTSPFDALFLPHDRPGQDETLLKLQRKRLSFLKSYLSDMRSETVFCSIPLSSPPSSHSQQLLLQIHSNPPHPSLTLLSRSSSSSSNLITRKITIRWISFGSDESGRWEINLGDEGRGDQGKRRSEREDDNVEEKEEREKSILLEEARRCWEILDGLRRGGVGERVWRGWVEGTSRGFVAQKQG